MRETIGRLLQTHSDLPPTTAGLTKERHTIPALRRERLREALSRFGASVAAESVAVVADGLGTGHLAVTDTAVYLINDGGTRIKAECKCKSGSGGCVFKVAGSNAACLPGGDKPCQKCGFILGLTVPRSQLVDLADDLGSLGQDFLDQLPDGLAETAHDLARLDYPLADRVALRDQLKVRGLEVSSALMPIVFPIFSLADALDKLFAGTTGNLMRWAVGDYEPNTVRNLALALSAGAIQADESSRELTVVTIAKDNGVVVDVSCSCAKGSGTCYLGTMPDLGGSSALEQALPDGGRNSNRPPPARPVVALDGLTGPPVLSPSVARSPRGVELTTPSSAAWRRISRRSAAGRGVRAMSASVTFLSSLGRSRKRPAGQIE